MTAKGLIDKKDHPVILQNIKATHSKYGKFIKQAARLTNVPEIILHAIIYLESAGKPLVVSGAGAVGLMQLTPDTATAILHIEHKQGRLMEGEKKVLGKVLGKRLDCILKLQYLSQNLPCAPKGKVVTAQDLKDPEFNILCGAILVGNLIDQHTEGKQIRLDKLIVRYNAGYFYKPQGATIEETLAFAQKKGGKETVGYILKFVGKDGMIDLLRQNQNAIA